MRRVVAVNDIFTQRSHDADGVKRAGIIKTPSVACGRGGAAWRGRGEAMPWWRGHCLAQMQIQLGVGGQPQADSLPSRAH